MQVDLNTAIVAVITALATWVLKPIAERYIEAFFKRKPVFAIHPYVLRDNWLVQIQPVNGPARRKKPLHLSFQGTLTMGVGVMSNESDTLGWTLDISSIEVLRDELRKATFVDVQLFFDASQMSEPVRLTYKPVNPVRSAQQSPPISIETVRALIQSVSSHRIVHVSSVEILLNDGFPLATENVRWNSVFDGKELVIAGVEHFEIEGDDAALLVEPQYSWVITFENCRNIAITDLTLGHVSAGYCQGGVLRFVNCNGVKVRNCDLYGSGTYGFEFENCADVDVDNTTVRDCSYGILKISNSQNITFTGCVFADNREFDLCSFFGEVEQIMFRKCSFERNQSGYSMFRMDGITGGGGVYVWGCKFSYNVCRRLNDGGWFLSENNNEYVGNSWESSPQIN
ncbi:right-handed parallel beta-helix repeat-containing protein [Bradyrhizobium sp. SZCCHNRI20481]|uniref:right-handed parallel beta-helix repeat-containing protein n=1 Tax=Bradyrhizobium sp. SZCCHNRI20481 TaxID=3057286 RepID=UPI002915FB36|nr:right-handed parallel beta-helix repeat-containing protein [Bradyrhizobium sp. SZCCHNRI20481]